MTPLALAGLVERWTGLALRAPHLLWLAVPVVAFGLWMARRPRPSLGFAPASLLDAPPGSEPLPRSRRSAMLRLPGAVFLAGLLLAVVALARPARREALPLETRGIDVLLCLDTSSSMTQTDMEAGRTRLDVAKDAAARFVAARPDDRIGLVTFARYADLRCPPTLDHRALGRILEAVAPIPGDDAEDATGIGTAVARAAQALADSPSKSRVVVLLTDGEETVAASGAAGEIAPSHAAQLAQSLGLRVYAILAGTGRVDAAGATVRADPRSLARLAQRTGGEAFEARDAAAVAAVYAQIDALERTPFAEARHVLVDRFLPFLLAALACLVVARLLRAGPLAVLP